MKKYLLLLVVVLVMMSQVPSYVQARSGSVGSPTKNAIKKYKRGNFTGCLQDCQNIVRREPHNSLAYYYLAMSYVQAGLKDPAIASYSRVLSSNPNGRLREYASTGKRCLETPDKCHLESPNDSPELDRFIASPNVLSNSVKSDINKRNLHNIKNEINADKNIDSYEFKKFTDYSHSKSKVDTGDKVSERKPTNAEIAAALAVLKSAGMNNVVKDDQVAQAEQQTQLQGQATDTQQSPDLAKVYSQVNQTPEMAEINMMLGGDNNNQSNNANAMLNMLPYMAAQSGKAGGASTYSPQMMQAVIMNSMMNSMNFNMDSKDNK